MFLDPTKPRSIRPSKPIQDQNLSHLAAIIRQTLVVSSKANTQLKSPKRSQGVLGETCIGDKPENNLCRKWSFGLPYTVVKHQDPPPCLSTWQYINCGCVDKIETIPIEVFQKIHIPPLNQLLPLESNDQTLSCGRLHQLENHYPLSPLASEW